MAQIDVNSIKPNSHAYKDSLTEPLEQKNSEEKKKVEKVTTGIRQKKTMGDGLKEDMIEIGKYAWKDVIIPSLKKTVETLVKSGIDMLLYKTVSPQSGRPTASRFSYDSCYQSSQNPPTRSPSRYTIDTVRITTRQAAEEVLNRMDEILATYRKVSVADFYELVDITSEYTDYNYGWVDLRQAQVMRVGDGYIIQFPKVIPLK